MKTTERKGRTREGEPLTIENVREQIIGIDVRVPLLDGSSRPVVNFDNAATTPALRPVVERVNEFLPWYASVHRGAGLKSQISTRVYDQAHEIVCRFVGADPSSHVVIFGKNSTEALNKLARRLPFREGDVVLTTLMEHHSNDLPWREAAQVERIALDKDGCLCEEDLDRLLERYRGRVRIVAITGASNVTGVLNPIHRIAEKVHAAGAEIVVDAAQLAAHRAINMRSPDDPGHIDYLVFSAHKMYAPFGTGALVGRREPFLQGNPDLVGGGTANIVTTEEVTWADLPDREEAGSPNVVGALALAEASLCLNEIGMDAIATHEETLTAYALERLARLELVKVYGPSEPARARDRVGVLSFTVEGMQHAQVAAILSAEGGIAVRNGFFCAQPYILHLLDISPEQARRHYDDLRRGIRGRLPGLVRISFGCYNSQAEVDWFIEVLERIVRGSYRGCYVQDPVSGDFRPEGFAPDPEAHFCLT